MTIGYISIGSNIDKEINIPSSLDCLRKLFGCLEISSIYETEAVGFPGDKFHNLIVRFESELDPKNVVKQLRQIELDHGRHGKSPKFSARTLDLDLISYGEHIIREDRLRIPREDIEIYAFVLEPLAEIAADVAHPITGERYGQLWKNFDKRGINQHKVFPAWLLNK